MSRLRAGRHTVAVMPVLAQGGPYAPEESGEPVEVQCNVQPVSADEIQRLGLKTSTVYRVKYFPGAHGQEPWPGGAYSKITWGGRVFEQRGEALLSSMSERTSHYKVIMVDPSSEVR